MEIEEHRDEFLKIIDRYDLQKEDKAEEIAVFLTNGKENEISAREFASKFCMSVDEAVIFLSFIHKGVKFKEENIDKK
ncbi:hypothetical protein C0585_06160 [Candidatus Woesearchaeota archaeon]|nr:MAG: hypothetical protein C0585_06160 [Candidatus Woesearchaeota archaeon]